MFLFIVNKNRHLLLHASRALGGSSTSSLSLSLSSSFPFSSTSNKKPIKNQPKKPIESIESSTISSKQDQHEDPTAEKKPSTLVRIVRFAVILSVSVLAYRFLPVLGSSSLNSGIGLLKSNSPQFQKLGLERLESTDAAKGGSSFEKLMDPEILDRIVTLKSSEDEKVRQAAEILMTSLCQAYTAKSQSLPLNTLSTIHKACNLK